MKNKKPWLIILLIAIFLIANTVGCSKETVQPSGETNGQEEIETITLEIISAFERGSATAWYVEPFIKRVEEKSDGHLKIRWVGGPEVMAASDQAEAVMRGTMDMAIGVFSYYGDILPGAEAFDLTEYTPSEERENGAYELLEEVHKQINCQYLGKISSGRNFFLLSNKKIENLNDFNGLKFRASPTTSDFMEKLGIVPVMQPWSETYSALETGMVVGVGGPLTSFASYSLQEVVDYLIVHGFYDTTHSLIVNQKVWDSLPEYHQNVLHEVMVEWEPYAREYEQKAQEEVIKSFVEQGMELIELPDAIAQEYLKLASDAAWEMVKDRLDDATYQRYVDVLRK
ncbi:MAG: TRAP transporter substrate-binding protein DctP [Desulfitobacteriia bacterium]|jgi:TRAP-type C4-dicarboxylate transport system substrate-binding protein